MKPRWVDAPVVRVVLRGDYAQLTSAFDWKFTPQGYAHWRKRSLGDMPLDVRDLAYVALLLEEA